MTVRGSMPSPALFFRSSLLRSVIGVLAVLSRLSMLLLLCLSMKPFSSLLSAVHPLAKCALLCMCPTLTDERRFTSSQSKPTEGSRTAPRMSHPHNARSGFILGTGSCGRTVRQTYARVEGSTWKPLPIVFFSFHPSSTNQSISGRL